MGAARYVRNRGPKSRKGRRWFACPRCTRGCRILYFLKGKLASRLCQHLGYASDYDSQPDTVLNRARAIVKATTHFDDPKVLLEVSADLVGAMKGLAVGAIAEADMLQKRGW